MESIESVTLWVSPFEPLLGGRFPTIPLVSRFFRISQVSFPPNTKTPPRDQTITRKIGATGNLRNALSMDQAHQGKNAGKKSNTLFLFGDNHNNPPSHSIESRVLTTICLLTNWHQQGYSFSQPCSSQQPSHILISVPQLFPSTIRRSRQSLFFALLPFSSLELLPSALRVVTQ